MSEKINGINCPYCGGQLYKNDRFFYCEKSGQEEGLCHFFTGYIQSNGEPIPEEDLIALARGEKVGPYTFHSAKTDKDYEASLQIDRNDACRPRFAFKQNGTETSHLCPICSKKLIKREGQYGPYLTCPERHFSLSTTFSGYELTDDDLETVINGGTTEVKTLHSAKKNKDYSAALRIDPETHRIAPVFPER